VKGLGEPFHKLLKDFKLNEWFEAADGCDTCGSKAKVMITHVDETGAFGHVQWRIFHKQGCPEVYNEETLGIDAEEDVVGWEFEDKPFTFQGKQYYPLKSRANIGPCLACGQLVIGVPLILFIDKGRKGELDFCWECVKSLGIMEMVKRR
jgi:hypothetical protein